MKELQDIFKAYDDAVISGKQMALATVVTVEGSSYRRPGARMLVTEDGILTGAISGGCLEGDALRKAQLAIAGQCNKLVTYDTTDEDDSRIGIQLGCNGIIHILFEPLTVNDPLNPVALLKRLMNRRCDHVVATLFNSNDRKAHHPGTCFLLNELESISAIPAGTERYKKLYGDAVMTLKQQQSTISSDDGLTAFIELIPPPVSLVIAGAGNDAMPLATIAHQLGWTTIIADGRSTHNTRQRFPNADQLLIAPGDRISQQITHDRRTVYVLMTHNYNYDYGLLRSLVQQECTYIGSLGPRKKLERMLEELMTEGIPMHEKTLQQLHGPVGLDIGAETAEEIAIAVIAEIKAVLQGKKAGFLKDRNVPIHAPDRQLTHYPARSRRTNSDI